jgi:hypothetical protein
MSMVNEILMAIKAMCDHRKAETYLDTDLTYAPLFADRENIDYFIDQLIELARRKLNLGIHRRRNISENA